MELKLRTLHPDPEGDFYSYLRNPSEAQIEQAIRAPVFHFGQGRLGDVMIYRGSERVSSLRFYLGLPGRALVLFQPFADRAIKQYVRICGERSDAFVVIPDIAADEYYNIPHKMLIPLEDAIDSAKQFLVSEGTSFAPDSETEEFTLNWIRWYEIDECMDPFGGAIQEYIEREKANGN